MSASEADLHQVSEDHYQDGVGELFQITRDQYAANRKANVRGTANPSIMNNPFWLFQVSPKGIDAWSARAAFGNTKDPFTDTKDPVWCFNRFGGTRIKLPDGRIVCIGGEHEDSYDPDFCIYNGDYFINQYPLETTVGPLHHEAQIGAILELLISYKP